MCRGSAARSVSRVIFSEGGTAIRPEDRTPAATRLEPTAQITVPEASSGVIPLVVDLDGALVRSDLMLESLMLLVKRRPWRLLPVLGRLLAGMAQFKHNLAREVMPEIGSLPFDPGFLRFLEQQKAAGRPLVLVTGADIRVAEAVAAHTGLFDQVISSDGSNNVHDRLKLDLLVTRFGLKGFDYAGSNGRDGPVVSAARRAILVGAPAAEALNSEGTAEVEEVITRGGAGLAAYWNALRPGQWIKNVLVFMPLLTAVEPFEPIVLLTGFIAAAAFSLCASSGYIVNDLMDVPSDRHHPAKRNRPIASGQVSIGAMLVLVPVLFLAGIAVGALLPPLFTALLCIYYALTLAYSLRLKDIAVLDVLVLALLYTIRVLAGAIACGLTASVWLLAFCVFLFLSLGLVKRYGELVVMRSVEGSHAHARAYLLQDRELLAGFGAASGYVAAVLLALSQTRSDGAPGAVGMDLAGWGICLLFIYWISHVWLVAHRGRMGDDPLSFAVRDRTSRVLILIACAAFAVRWFL